MPESGHTCHTWRKSFKGELIEAAHVRLWTAGRVTHPDAPLIANELYIAVLGSGAPVVEMTLSTADTRIRIMAEGSDPLPLLYSHGPGWTIVTGLSTRTGLTTDERGLWAQLQAEVYTCPGATGCSPHTAEQAHRALLDHASMCEQCVDNQALCATGSRLYRLARKPRR